MNKEEGFEIEGYHKIDSWDTYTKFIGSGDKHEKPSFKPKKWNKIGAEAETIEEVYDDVSYVVKEQAGLPTRYFMLTPDQIYFLENFTNLLDKPDVNELLCALVT